MEPHYTNSQISEYVLGWLTSEPTHDIVAIKSMLHNAALMLEDDQDGIEAVEARSFQSFVKNEEK